MKKGELEKKLKKKYKKIYEQTVREGRKNITIYSAAAKKNTPVGKIELGSPYWKRKGGSKRVHVGTYVPSTKRTFIFSSKYAKKK